MKGISAEEGLVSIPYENKFGQWGRILQFTKLFLYHPSSGLYTCPLAMTDGAAKTIKVNKYYTLRLQFIPLSLPFILRYNDFQFYSGNEVDKSSKCLRALDFPFTSKLLDIRSMDDRTQR